MAQLRCSDVTLGYEGTAVMEHLSFSVSAGDYLYIVGENGSGKSTLMKAILGLKSPMAGKIETGDGLKPDEIGYLPQQTAVQRDFPASVLEIVRSGCLNRSGLRPVLHQAGKAAGAGQHGTAGHHPSGETVLSGTFRRSAAACPAGTGAGCDPENAGAG